MFWFRRNDGFDWKDYVRTTVLVRRKARQEKILEFGEVARDGLIDAGRKGLEAGKAGIGAAGQKIAEGGEKLAHVPAQAARGIWSMARPGLVAATAPVQRLLERPGVEKGLLGFGALAALSAGVRWWQFGWDRDTLVVTIVAIAALAPVGIARLAKSDVAIAVARLPRPHISRETAAIFAAGAFAAAMVWFALPVVNRWFTSEPRAIETSAIPTVSSELRGRASAMSTGQLKIAGETVALTGIEALDPDQSCARSDGTRWRCGADAKAALQKLARSRDLVCTRVAAAGADVAGVRCETAGKDVSETLVRGGYAFAASGLFADYATAEADAKTARAGVWSGDGERPADWRNRLWSEASRAAPGGCPIKGRITSGSRVYVLPWSPGYERVTVREARGERWFCSEQDAEAAGWKRAARF